MRPTCCLAGATFPCIEPWCPLPWRCTKLSLILFCLLLPGSSPVILNSPLLLRLKGTKSSHWPHGCSLLDIRRVLMSFLTDLATLFILSLSSPLFWSHHLAKSILYSSPSLSGKTQHENVSPFCSFTKVSQFTGLLPTLVFPGVSKYPTLCLKKVRR